MNLKSRQHALQRFKTEKFDLLIIGGGITGAATARDAASRGLKVALMEREDFAIGTSSRSSKLIHGGLRYLENLEFGLVFEALAERTLLLKSCPHLVKPLPFYMPVYQGDPHSKNKISMGLWLYDLLALFRAPGFHRRLTQTQMIAELPTLNSHGLTGGFRYYDASMLDDVMVHEILRSANGMGAVVANYCEALEPRTHRGQITGFLCRDMDPYAVNSAPFEIQARRVISCTGPWTDLFGKRSSPHWKQWLRPSKGVHVLFPYARLPLPGALVMSHPSDGRIVFVMPRPELGEGVTIVGTTDGGTDPDPSAVKVESADIDYLMKLLERYFPTLKLRADEIISAYAGVRPLVDGAGMTGSEGQSRSLQKISREHHIEESDLGMIVVAGGKYTTHRTMAQEIVDFSLQSWKRAALKGKVEALPHTLGKSATQTPVNTRVMPEVVEEARALAEQRGMKIPDSLFLRYGAEAMDVAQLHYEHRGGIQNQQALSKEVSGFPMLAAQLRFAIQQSMALRLTDFYFRRVPLFMAAPDQGLSLSEELARVWAQERGLDLSAADREQEFLEHKIFQENAWKKTLL